MPMRRQLWLLAGAVLYLADQNGAIGFDGTTIRFDAPSFD